MILNSISGSASQFCDFSEIPHPSGNRRAERNAKMKMIYLAPHDQKQLEEVLLRGIKECNNGIKRCNAEGNIRGAEYIREVKRRPLIKKLQDVRKGIIWE